MSERVIVVGAGPTGLMLAHELALAGIACTVLEKRAEQPNITRAFGVASRTLELLDARGLADELVAKGNIVSTAGLNAGVSIDLTLIPSRFAFMLIAPQSLTERALEARCAALGVEIVRGAEVVGVGQDADAVTLTVAGPAGTRTERAAYVVGCDGARSAVRRELGVPFVGKEYEWRITLADVRLRDAPTDFVSGEVNSHGVSLLIPFGDGYHRAIIWDRQRDNVSVDVPVTLEEIRDAARRIAGSDFGMHDPRWKSRFLSEQRQAAHYRFGRVLLAGDAAHTHSPIGAQGMNTGIGDGMNLGWKLAAELRGTAPGWLLDSYESERHPVGATVLRMTNVLTRAVLVKSDLLLTLVQLAMRVALSFEPLRRRPRGLLSGVGISYRPRGEKPHRLAGRRAPEVDVPGGRLYEALRDGRFVLVDRSPSATAARRARLGWGDRVTVRAGTPPTGTDPLVMVVRPDAYVAWASDREPTADELDAVLTDWCGPALPAAVLTGGARDAPQRPERQNR